MGIQKIIFSLTALLMLIPVLVIAGPDVSIKTVAEMELSMLKMNLMENRIRA